jgi:Kef-type K+ transport system membrane component KefB
MRSLTSADGTPGAEGTDAATQGTDPWVAICVTACAVSLLGFLTLLVGHLVDPSSFNNTKQAGPGNSIAFFAYVLGTLAALVLGGATWFYGRQGSRRSRTRAGRLTAGYGLTALVVAVIAASMGA